MLRLINLVDEEDGGRLIEVVVYRSLDDAIMIAINVEGGCLARLLLPATGSFEDSIGRVSVELAESSPPVICRSLG